MKHLLFATFAVGLLALSGFTTYRSTAAPSRVGAYFTNKSTMQELLRVQTEMAQKGIVVTYKKLEFNKAGKLMGIDLAVDCKDGFSGTANKTPLSNRDRIGFFRDYEKGAPVAFQIGRIE